MIGWFTDIKTSLNLLLSTPYDTVVLDLILNARYILDKRIIEFQQDTNDYLCKLFALAKVIARLHSYQVSFSHHIDDQNNKGLKIIIKW